MAPRDKKKNPNLTLIEQLHCISSYVQGEGFARLDKGETRQMQRLSLRQAHAVGILYRYMRLNGEGMPMNALATALHMSASAVSHMVDSLERQELVVRGVAEQDHRCILVTVHPRRQPYAENIEQGMQDAIAYLQSKLTEEEIAIFNRCIERMYECACAKKKRRK